MEGNTGPIEWVQEWLDWLHREWIGLWQELQDREGRERVWMRIKAHLREWIVYYVFGVCLLVIGYGLWMDGEDGGARERVARGPGRGNVKGLMTGGGAEGSTNGNTISVAARRAALLASYKENQRAKPATELQLSKSNQQYTNPNLKHAKSYVYKTEGGNSTNAGGGGRRNRGGSVNSRTGLNSSNSPNRVNSGSQTNPEPEFTRNMATGSNKTQVNQGTSIETQTVPEQKLASNAASQTNNQPNPVNNSKQPKEPSSKAPPAKQPGIPIEASSSVSVSVEVAGGGSQPAPAAPAANVPKQPAKTNTPTQTESGEKPPAGQQPAQQPGAPQKGSRKDQGADAIKAAVDAVNQKKAQKQVKKTERNKQGKQYAAQAKEVSKQFKRPSAGSAEAGRLLDQVKQGVGQQFDKIGSILFSFLTAIGLATAAGVTTLKETGYEPAKKVATMAMHI